ncbi:cytochrome C4, partial [mine drainage metagenome]
GAYFGARHTLNESDHGAARAGRNFTRLASEPAGPIRLETRLRTWPEVAMSELWLRLPARSGVRLAAAIVALSCGTLAASATATQPPLGNAREGRIIGYTCLGCHGIKGYRNAYPDYNVPRLRGQSAQYLYDALKEYRSGARAYPTMHLQALSLDPQQMRDVAAYLGG